MRNEYDVRCIFRRFILPHTIRRGYSHFLPAVLDIRGTGWGMKRFRLWTAGRAGLSLPLSPSPSMFGPSVGQTRPALDWARLSVCITTCCHLRRKKERERERERILTGVKEPTEIVRVELASSHEPRNACARCRDFIIAATCLEISRVTASSRL